MCEEFISYSALAECVLSDLKVTDDQRNTAIGSWVRCSDKIIGLRNTENYLQKSSDKQWVAS